MPLVLKAEAAHSRPVIMCDHCGLAITDAHDGKYLWRLPDPGRSIEGTIYFSHKSCCRAFEAQSSDLTWGSTELPCLLVYLANDLRVEWDSNEAREACLTTS